MSFLGVAFLFALPLAALPVVLHLMDRRRNVEIDWGAMQFLRVAATQRTRTRRLQEWLLLLCRVAAIAALVFALARPLVPFAWLGGRPRSETILVIDNSLSSSRQAGELTKFQSIVDEARQRIEALPQQDAARLLVTSPIPTWIELGDDVNEQLAQLAPTLDESDLVGALMIATQANVHDGIQRREIIVLSDGVASNWDLDDESAWERLRAVIGRSKIATTIQIAADQPHAIGANLAVTEVATRHAVVGLDEPVSIRAKLKNFSASESTATDASWFVDGKQIEQVPVAAIEPSASQDLVWDYSFDRRGVYAITCRLDIADALAGDNESSVIVEVVDRVPILLVDEGDGFTETDQDAYFTQAALGYGASEDDAAWHSVYEPRVVGLAQLETIDLDAFRAVVIPNLQEIPAGMVERLNAFVAAGGGLWLALGPRTDIRQFNHRLYDDGDGLSPVRLDTLVELADDTPPLLINPYLGSHPATTQLVDSQKMDTGDVVVSQRIRFDSQTLTPHVSVLLGLTNGEPLVVEQTAKRGRVIVQAIPLRRQWSELIRSQAFVVMVQDWLSYLTQPRATQHNLIPGQPLSCRFSPAQHLTATLTDPAGSTVDLTGQAENESVLFHTTRTHLPGLYHLEPGLSGLKIPFYVRRSNAESDLTLLTAKQREWLKDSVTVDQVSLADDGNTGVGRPIWPLLLIALAMFMVGDYWLSGKISRQRYGVDAIASREPDIVASSVPGYPTPLPSRPSTGQQSQTVRV